MKNGMKLRLFRSFIYLLGGVAIGWTAHVKYTSVDPQVQFNEAARQGWVSEMEKLERDGVNPLASPFFKDVNDYDSSAIIAAASAGQFDAVKHLLKKGANANDWVADSTVLDCAIYRQDEAQKSVDILRKHGAKTLSETDRLSN